MASTKDKRHHPVVRAAKAVHRHAKDHFIPHEGNNHIPHVLKHRVLLGYSVALVLLKAVVITVSLILPSASVLSGAITQANIITLTNEARSGQGLTPLKTNTKLTNAAAAKAADMLEKQYFAHTSPSGTTPWAWIRQAGYAYTISGENLAVHYTTAEGTFAGWLASPSHRANIVSTKFTETGVGIAEGVFEGHPSIVVVQMFGRPVGAKDVPAAEAEKTAPTPAKQNTTTPVVVTTSTTGAVAGVKSKTQTTTKTVAQQPAAKKSEPPAIVSDTARIKPEGPGYSVALTIENASSAMAQLGEEQVNLESAEDGQTWRAVLAFDPRTAAPGGEKLTITAWNADGLNSGETVAMIAPEANAQELFAFAAPNSEPSYRLFGFIPLEGLRDHARQVYIMTMIFLATCLLISILIKIHVQRPTIILHTMVVIGLTAVLFKM
ncbi:hypothetical protein HZC53_02735 [Candidatus Uhrbacteria bacterium]|nr:hypothetical protein [Candidatus Uhrbacteria bacterium]